MKGSGEAVEVKCKTVLEEGAYSAVWTLHAVSTVRNLKEVVGVVVGPGLYVAVVSCYFPYP